MCHTVTNCSSNLTAILAPRKQLVAIGLGLSALLNYVSPFIAQVTELMIVSRVLLGAAQVNSGCVFDNDENLRCETLHN